METLTQEDVVQALGNLTVLEIIVLTRQLKQKWDVKAEPQMTQNTNAPVQVETNTVAQTEFNVVLVSYGTDKKMPCLKMIRELTGLGLKEAKDFVESLPKTVKDGVTKEEAEVLKASLVGAGGNVEIK